MRHFYKLINKLLLASLFAVLTVTVTHAGTPQSVKKSIDSKTSKTVDFNERLHLIFMREEEKLARDVYITLGMQYKDLKVFGNISTSEKGIPVLCVTNLVSMIFQIL